MIHYAVIVGLNIMKSIRSRTVLKTDGCHLTAFGAVSVDQ